MKTKNNNTIENSALCFTSLYPEELDFLQDKKTQLEYSKNEQIFKQGAFATHVIFINDGLVKISIQTGFDKQMNIRLASTGEFIAFSSVFGDNNYPYSATALRNSKICMIDKEALKNLLEENTDFAMSITSRNCRNETRLFEIIRNVSYKQMPGKLASALVYLSSPEFEKENIFTLLTRQDLAEFASVSTESAIKILKDFEQEGIIELKGKDILINNKEKLIEISERG
ncbi:MAG: Crp/Fnr family transcriptional regulator [Bacteroidales bacterium]|jgi:CRP/FNR family transcriptional regulator|nr:Crp/Fnr family transcriptional regulator [Bacteroidales bacterium]MCK9497967.1 Crp/Fnr family transcriptional regulator [Bacteroidales bacterium]MDY0315716.1 Crp/Fnr family transcriptional regulator [Bacteroidales bacterium]NLB86729.1 Crp/Fnr family transcriptional regulator [Bacteroidales bacterium]